jgi:NADH-quinone oxidoreductase chain G
MLDNWITFTVDGREVRAPEGEWLVDAVKRGDVEVPFFCYEPKLGPPVGACRMCLVEIEGIPKLQTSCSTPVKDGMVVYTQTDRVKEAQNAVVEFLLVNHPLDCPVCDKGGECPLQDISYGWGSGKSRFVEPKRNFPKPIALSPLVAIDRERCILCYRCVRFSQEVAEDYQLTFLERGDHTFVGTFDGRPYVAPFAGNIVELCPVGALTSTAYRFRARPWDIEDSGSVCTLCPSQCNIAFTVRDERVERVLARDNPAVDDGWLCDKGRWGYQSVESGDRLVAPLVREGGALRPTTWERALEEAVEGLRKAGRGSAAIVGDGTTNEEGYLLQRIFREALGSGHVDSRPNGRLEPATARMLSHPDLAVAVSDIDGASAVLLIETDPINEAPILDLRLRKAVRRFGARLVVASSRPTALDPGAVEVLRFAPGTGEAFMRGLQKALLEIENGAPPPDSNGFGTEEQAARGQGRERVSGGTPDAAPGATPHDRPREPRGASPPSAPSAPPPAGDANGAREQESLEGQARLARFLAEHSLERLAELAEVEVQDLRDTASLLTEADNLLVIWGERLGDGERGPAALRALVDLALILGLDAAPGSGLLEIPAQANGRGLREVGCLPGFGPGLTEAGEGMSAQAIRDSAANGDLGALYLLHADPLRGHPGQSAWDEALRATPFVVAHEQFLSASVDRHANVVFPAEAYAEKEGTVTHPDGRVQRLRPAVGHPGEVRIEWQLLVELGTRLGLDLGRHVSAGEILAEIAEQAPPYRGLTLDEIGGRGVRWQQRDASLRAALPVLEALAFGEPAEPQAAPRPADGSLRLDTTPDLWASWETDRSPSLRFLRPAQELILSPVDAERLGVASGEPVQVASNGSAVQAAVRVRESAKRGTCYLIEGTAEENANLLTDGAPLLVNIPPAAGKPAAGTEQPPSAGKPAEGFQG